MAAQAPREAGASARAARRAGAPADDDRRRQRSAGLADHGVAGPQPRRRRAPFGETRERVMKAAARLGYQPVRRGVAPAPRRGRRSASSATKSRPIPGRRSVSTACAKRRGSAGSPSWSWRRAATPTWKAAALAQLTAQPLLGLIYATINTRLVDAPATPPQMPIVLLNCHVANGSLPSVVPGEVAGGHAATDVLIRAGHRRIGYINGEASMEASRHA